MMIPPALSPSWKRLSILLTGVIILQLIFTHQISDVASQAGFPTTPRRKLLPWDQLPTGVDGEILDNLSDAQCDFAFPDLYHEVDRATTYWQQRDHTISGEDTNITWRDTFAMRLLIHDNQIRVLQGRGTFDNGTHCRLLTVVQTHCSSSVPNRADLLFPFTRMVQVTQSTNSISPASISRICHSRWRSASYGRDRADHGRYN